MKTDLLANRHIGIHGNDLPDMLRKIGVKSLDELIDKTIPANIRLKERLKLPEYGKDRAGPYGRAQSFGCDQFSSKAYKYSSNLGSHHSR